MRSLFQFAAFGAVTLAASTIFAQVVAPQVDPNINGPARRAAAGTGDALGAPGVERRMERRAERREAVNPNAAIRADARANAPATVNPDQWRFKWHNNQWWYYTPQNQWMVYTNNAWSNYDPNTYVVPRYNTGYRGNVNDGYYYYNNGRRFFRGQYGPATAPYSNGTPAGNAGSNLGADIGAAAGGGAGANTGAAIGGAIGNAVGDVNNARAPVPAPVPDPVSDPVPNNR